jgi:hypothetical protein
MIEHSGAPSRFTYVGWSVDAIEGRVSCSYELDGEAFTEIVGLEGGGDLSSEAAQQAARLLFLLAGVSYFKTQAPPVIDFGEHSLSEAECDLLTQLYRDGLAEFAYVNGLELGNLELRATIEDDPQTQIALATRGALVPFGGGIDSIVSVDVALIADDDPALFVVSRPGDRFAAIEAAAGVTELEVLRAWREIDPKLLDGIDRGYLNGHVPVTAIVSAIAVLVAAAHDRGPVVMSNERSASIPALIEGREVNHQWSKSWAFEQAFAKVLSQRVPSVGYFSLLRPCSELWVAQRFAKLRAFHPYFRSCNRSFTLDPSRRMEAWCGVCDKCAFIDLILAPFLSPAELSAIFDGAEPLENPQMLEQFESLVGLGDQHKPLECVGDLDECIAAVILAADREDRSSCTTLQALATRVPPRSAEELNQLLHPSGPQGIHRGFIDAADLG